MNHQATMTSPYFSYECKPAHCVIISYRLPSFQPRHQPSTATWKSCVDFMALLLFQLLYSVCLTVVVYDCIRSLRALLAILWGFSTISTWTCFDCFCKQLLLLVRRFRYTEIWWIDGFPRLMAFVLSDTIFTRWWIDNIWCCNLTSSRWYCMSKM